MYDASSQNAQLLFKEILRGNTDDVQNPPSRIVKCFISSSGKTGTFKNFLHLSFFSILIF